MAYLIAGLPVWVLLLISFGLSFLIAVPGVHWVRRRVPLSVLQAHHEVAGSLSGVVGTVFAVMLSMMVVVMWQQYDAARTRVAVEAAMVGDLYRDAGAFASPVREELRERIRSYAQITIAEEWPALARGSHSQNAWLALDGLWAAYGSLEPAGQREVTFYGESIARLTALEDARRARLLASQPQIPGILWAALILCGSVTIAFRFVLGLENPRTQGLMTGVVTGVVVFALFALVSLDFPFCGDATVSPLPFDRALASMAAQSAGVQAGR